MAWCVVRGWLDHADDDAGRFNDEFVEERRQKLEKFLHHVAAHEQAKHSPAFLAFLDISLISHMKHGTTTVTKQQPR